MLVFLAARIGVVFVVLWCVAEVGLESLRLGIGDLNTAWGVELELGSVDNALRDTVSNQEARGKTAGAGASSGPRRTKRRYRQGQDGTDDDFSPEYRI
jgi:hypothetical protein